MSPRRKRGLVLYYGMRFRWGTHVVRDTGEDVTELTRRSDLAIYTLGDYEWHRVGPGARQLALDLLAHVLGDGARSLAVVREFEWVFIRRLPDAGWTLDACEILRAVESIEEHQRIAREMVDIHDSPFSA